MSYCGKDETILDAAMPHNSDIFGTHLDSLFLSNNKYCAKSWLAVLGLETCLTADIVLFAGTLQMQ